MANKKASGEIKKKFDFQARDGSRVTILVRAKKSASLPLELEGPHGKKFFLALGGLEKRSGAATASGARSDIESVLERELESLSAVERDEMRKASLVASSGRANATVGGPIVRFDCTWVTWPD
jgi:hypothetical protein